MNNANSTSFFFFWGHTQKKDNIIDKSCLSQWYPSIIFTPSFLYSASLAGISYDKFSTAEHFMMAEKARLFNDKETYKQIIDAPTPKEAKALGRTIKNFNENIWQQHCYDIVLKVTRTKFAQIQNEELRAFLYSTRGSQLVEASPNDAIWGIGISVDHPDIHNSEKWLGLNLLGKALTQVRDELYAHVMILPLSEKQWIELDFCTSLDTFNFSCGMMSAIWLVTDNKRENIGIFNIDSWSEKISTLKKIINSGLDNHTSSDKNVYLDLKPFSPDYFDDEVSIFTISYENALIWKLHIKKIIDNFNDFMYKTNVPSN